MWYGERVTSHIEPLLSLPMYVETVALERQTNIESHLPGDGVKTTSGHVKILAICVELLERGIDN